MSIRLARLSLATIAGIAAVLSGATPTWSQGTDEERRACTPDVMRLCREYIPSVDRIVACMEARHAELSPACQAVISPPAPVATAATTTAKPAVRRGASRTTGGKSTAVRPRPAKPAVQGAPAAARKTATQKTTAKGTAAAKPLNLLPVPAKPAPGKKGNPRDKQARRTL